MIGTDFERCYRAVQSRDARFDGWFFTAVTSTGIYCRPSCPAMTPKAVERALLPHRGRGPGRRVPRVPAVPTRRHSRITGVERARRPRRARDAPDRRRRRRSRGSRRARPAARLQRAAPQPAADCGGRCGADRARSGATRSERARAHRDDRAALRARGVRCRLLEHPPVQRHDPTDLRDDTQRHAHALASGRDLAPPGVIVLRLPCRTPFDGDAVVEFLAARAVPGIEEMVGTTYRRTLRLAHGAGVAELTPQPDHVRAVLRLDDLRDLTTAVQRCRRVFDLDADPQAVAEQLGADRILGRARREDAGAAVAGNRRWLRARDASRARAAGLRLRPRARWPLGSSPPTARRSATPDGGLTHLFPQAEAIVELVPGSTGDARRAKGGARPRVATAVANDEVVIDAGADRAATTAGLLDIRGVGPWTASLHHDAWPRRSRRVPADRPRCAQRARTPRICRRRPKDVADARGALAPVALVRRDAPLEVAVMKTASTATMATPCGPFTIVMDDDAVIASGWTTSTDELMETVSSSLRPTTITARARPRRGDRRGHAVLRGGSARDRRHRGRQHSGPFIEQAWDVLRTVPAGLADHVRGARGEGRAPRRGARRGERVRLQRRRAVRAVPPSRPHGRRSLRASSGRVPLGAAGEAVAARPRGRNRKLSRVSDAVLSEFSEFAAMLGR